jgi:hypothetical protein
VLKLFDQGNDKKKPKEASRRSLACAKMSLVRAISKVRRGREGGRKRKRKRK